MLHSYAQCQDLATIWLHLDGGTLTEQRHCGDGPLITGLHADTPPGQWPPALSELDWSTHPELLCDHRA